METSVVKDYLFQNYVRLSICSKTETMLLGSTRPAVRLCSVCLGRHSRVFRFYLLDTCVQSLRHFLLKIFDPTLICLTWESFDNEGFTVSVFRHLVIVYSCSDIGPHWGYTNFRLVRHYTNKQTNKTTTKTNNIWICIRQYWVFEKIKLKKNSILNKSLL